MNKETHGTRPITDGRRAREFLDLLEDRIFGTLCPGLGPYVEPSRLRLDGLRNALVAIAKREGVPAEIILERTPDLPMDDSSQCDLQMLVLSGEWTMYLRFRWRGAIFSNAPVWYLDLGSVCRTSLSSENLR